MCRFVYLYNEQSPKNPMFVLENGADTFAVIVLNHMSILMTSTRRNNYHRRRKVTTEIIDWQKTEIRSASLLQHRKSCPEFVTIFTLRNNYPISLQRLLRVVLGSVALTELITVISVELL